MFFALYWRSVFAIVLLVASASSFLQLFNIFVFVTNTNHYPSLFWLLISLLSIIPNAICRNGLIYLLSGKRLSLNSKFWQQLNFAFTLLFMLLSIMALIVFTCFNHQFWADYKLFAQPLMLLILPALYIKRALTLTDQSAT